MLLCIALESKVWPRASLGLAFVCNRVGVVEAGRMKGFSSSGAVDKASLGGDVALTTSISTSCLVVIATSLGPKQGISALVGINI